VAGEGRGRVSQVDGWPWPGGNSAVQGGLLSGPSGQAAAPARSPLGHGSGRWGRPPAGPAGR